MLDRRHKIEGKVCHLKEIIFFANQFQHSCKSQKVFSPISLNKLSISSSMSVLRALAFL
jgi:hypothetical protein